MTGREERDILRRLEMLSRVKPSAEDTQQAMDRVRNALLAEARKIPLSQPSVIKLFVAHPFIRIAAAACIVIALTLGILHKAHSARPGARPVARTDQRQTGIIAPLPAGDTFQIAKTLEGQLEQVDALFAAGNISGLEAVLDQGFMESKIAAAGYLKDIGTYKTIDTLAVLAKQWSGDPGNNPFAEAIRQIQDRLQEADTARLVSSSSLPQTPSIQTFEPNGVLSGLVLDAYTGKSVPGVLVILRGERMYQTTSDQQGYYRFGDVVTKGTYRLEAASRAYLGLEGGQGDVVLLDPSANVVKHLTLEPGCLVDIEVIDKDGQPVKDVRLTTSWLGSDHDKDVGQPIVTNTDGRATVGALKASDIAYLIIALHDDYAPERAIVKCSDPSVVEFNQIIMRKGVSVQGYAEYADGVPASGIEIYAIPNWWHSDLYSEGCNVDRDGTFRLGHIVPGSFSIHAFYRGAGPLSYGYEVTQAKLPLASPEELLIVKLPQDSPASLSAITGQIKWSAGRQAPYVDIMAFCPTGTFSRQRLIQGSDSFAMDGLKPGTYTLIFEGAYVQEQVVEGVEADGPALEVTLEAVPQPRLNGLVVQADSGEPIEAFQVSLMKTYIVPGLLYLPQEHWYPFTASGGVFEVNTPGPGWYQIQVVAEGYVPALLEQVEIHQTRQLVVELSRGGRIQGQVVDGAGRPIDGARVFPLSLMPTSRSVGAGRVADQDSYVETHNGAFQIDAVPEGMQSLKVTHPGYSTAIVDNVFVQEGQVAEELRITLQTGGTVEGYVYDAQGQPEANVTLFFSNGAVDRGEDEKAGQLATAVTDESGFYRIKGLPAALCLVERQNADRTLGVSRRAVYPQEDKTVTLNLGGAPTIHGQIILNGQPLSNQRVLLCEASEPKSGVFQCYDITAGDGSFSFGGVPVGTYAVYYQVPNEWGGWIKIKTIETTGVSLDAGILPEPQASVTLTVSAEAAITPESWDIYLRELRGIGSQATGVVKTMSRHQETFVFEEVLPGRYEVVAQCRDQARKITKTVEIAPPQDNVAVTMTIPAGTAIVSGIWVGGPGSSIALFSKDGSLVHLLDTHSEFYLVDRLPAGDYFIGHVYLADRAPYKSFHLEEGQARIVDIDMSRWPGKVQGLLGVQVMDRNGLPLTQADVWLEGPTGRIAPVIITSQEQLFIAPAGVYALYAAQEGFKSEHKEVVIQANEMIILYPERPLEQIRLDAEFHPSNVP